jgi:hypothetical protein
MQERMVTSVREMKAEIRASTEMFEALQGSLVSHRDIHQTRTEVVQEEIIAKLDAYQDRMEASMNA